MEKQEWYRRIPKVDVLLETDGIRQYIPAYGYECVREAVRAELSDLRAQIAQFAEGAADEDVLLNEICVQDDRRVRSVCGFSDITDRSDRSAASADAVARSEKGIERNRDDPAYELRQSAPWKGSGVPRAGDGERLLQSGI